MGTWGTKILDNDLSADIYEDYHYLTQKDFSRMQVCKKIFDQYLEELNDVQEKNIFWLTLAFIQTTEEPNVNPIVKENALSIIDSGDDLEQWMENPELYSDRKEELEQLKQKLLQ